MVDWKKEIWDGLWTLFRPFPHLTFQCSRIQADILRRLLKKQRQIL